MIRAAKAGDWREEDGIVVVTTPAGPVPLEAAEYELTTVVTDGRGEDQAATVLSGGGVVLLDIALDDVLLAEGFARDVVRAVQDERKASGLQVADRIRLHLTVPQERLADLETHREMVAKETLAVAFETVAGEVPKGVVALVVVTVAEPDTESDTEVQA